MILPIENHLKIWTTIIEFKKYICPYKDCIHKNEKECEVQKHVGKEILKSRYDNYIKFIEKR